MRIYLIGFMGAGKTSVGGSLANLLGYPLVDLDSEVEARAGLGIREIFEKHGEAVFREMEHGCLKETARFDDVVIATGGGAMVPARNFEVMRSLGTSVWLDPAFSTIVGRLNDRARQSRPLFADEERARELYRARLPAYRRADLHVEVGPLETAPQVAERIARRLRETHCDI